MEKTSMEKRLTSVCMTLNNYTEAEYDGIISQGENVRYLIVAKEVGEQGTPHLQMYCEFKTGSGGKTLSAIKKFFKTTRLHIEERKGFPRQASDYCKYDDYPKNTKENEFVEFGDMTKQGERTDWKQVVEDLKIKPVMDVIAENPHLLPFQRAMRDVKSMSLPSTQRNNIRVIVLYGDAGTGKTRTAFEHDADLYTKPKGDWWDGYLGEKTILLDDYYGYLSYSDLLRVLDRYKLQVPVKGGFVGARWDTVYITSNKSPSEWYSVGLTPALARRITEIYHLVKVGDTTEWFKIDDMNMETYEKTTDCVTGEQIRRGGGSLASQW